MAARHPRPHRSLRSVAFRLALFGSVAALPFAVAAPAARAAQQQEDEPPQVENARTQWIGRVVGNGVMVRSGPSGGAYPTMRIGDGTEVVIAGMKHEWLKIEPPEGSYSLVPKSKVNRRNNGSVGRTNDQTVVKAGSQLTRVKMGAQTRLEANTDVTIVGEEDEYYKIKPPEGAYLFVNQKDVKPLRRLKDPAGGGQNVASGQQQPQQPAPPQDASANNNQRAPEPRDGDTNSARPAPGGEQIATTVTPTDRGAGNGTRATQPAGEGEMAIVPTTQPSEPAALAKFQSLEQQFEAANGKPALEQPLDELQNGYAALLKDDAAGLPSSARRIAEIRVAALKARVAARDQYREFLKAKEEGAQRRQALVAEQTEIKERIEKTGIQTYTAVGTLRVSSLQQGNGTLYRLTDPATGRTVAYVRSTDPQYGRLLNQFVGIRGSVVVDPKLATRVITPTEAQAVDQSKVNNTVIAQIVPPSLIGSTANTPNGKAISE